MDCSNDSILLDESPRVGRCWKGLTNTYTLQGRQIDSPTTWRNEPWGRRSQQIVRIRGRMGVERISLGCWYGNGWDESIVYEGKINSEPGIHLGSQPYILMNSGYGEWSTALTIQTRGPGLPKSGLHRPLPCFKHFKDLKSPVLTN